MVNATEMCKAGNKKFNDWYRLDNTKELIKTLEKITNSEEVKNRETGFPVTQLIEIHKGNTNKYQQGSWIHPDLAVQLAQWISPEFAIQVSRWVRELVITGTVTLGDEKKQLELLQLQIEHKKLQDEHRKFLQKKTYHKFKKGPAFYIISDIDSKSIRFKPGFEGVDISNRLRQHRSSVPGCKLEFLIYSEDAKLVETLVLKRFDTLRTIKNKEWLFNIDSKELIKHTRTILDIVNIKYTEEDNIKAYNEEIDLDFSVENDNEEYNTEENEDDVEEKEDEENILS